MQFLILGPLEVTDDGRKLALGGPKQRAVLAHLILRANHVVPADLLIDGLWGEEPPESARNTLQTYVYRLRKVLGEDRIEGRDGGYVLAAADGEIDAERFQVLVKKGKAQAGSDPGAAAATLSDALSLWRADALADVTEEPSLRGEAARLEELRLSATEHRVSAEIAMGGHSTVVPELESLTARYPLRERMWANLMLALYRSGRQAEALSTFERARQVLADELGADPSPELRRLHEQILHGAPELGASAPAARPRPEVRTSRVDLQPGTEVAGYRIERTLGRGGMSVVYLAEHDWLQRKVALKVLAPQLAEDERFRERFVRESRLAASLDHPNVIPIYEAGASGGDLFIAMRYVEGTDLRTLLHEGGRARTRTGDRDRPAGRRRARRRARTGARAPGRQAGQRPARAAAGFGGGGARVPLGLRADQALERATRASPGRASSSGRSTTRRPSSSRAVPRTRAPTSTRSVACCSSA